MSKQFIGDCVGNPFDSVDELIDIIDEAEDITKEEFLNVCDISGMTWYGEDLKEVMEKYLSSFTYHRNGDIYFYQNSLEGN